MKHIRNLIVIIAIVMPLVFSNSCSKESNYKNRIIGRWVITSYSGYLYNEMGELLGSSSSTNSNHYNYYGSNYRLILGSLINMGKIIEFTSDGRVLVNDEYKGSFLINNNETIIMYGLKSNEEIYTIEKLSSSSLSITKERRNVMYDLRDENNNELGTFYDGVAKESFGFDKLGL